MNLSSKVEMCCLCYLVVLLSVLLSRVFQGHIGTSSRGVNMLIQQNIIVEIIKLAEDSDIFSVRGYVAFWPLTPSHPLLPAPPTPSHPLLSPLTPSSHPLSPPPLTPSHPLSPPPPAPSSRSLPSPPLPRGCGEL